MNASHPVGKWDEPVIRTTRLWFFDSLATLLTHQDYHCFTAKFEGFIDFSE